MSSKIPGFRSFNILQIDRSKFDTDTHHRATAVFMSTGQTTRFRETAIFLLFNVSVYFPFHVICD